MIYNIIDHRTRRFRWQRVNAVIEATSNDNSVDDSDQQPEADDDLMYDSRKSLSVHEAVEWANEQLCPVTLYLYDEGDGI